MLLLPPQSCPQTCAPPTAGCWSRADLRSWQRTALHGLPTVGKQWQRTKLLLRRGLGAKHLEGKQLAVEDESSRPFTFCARRMSDRECLFY